MEKILSNEKRLLLVAAHAATNDRIIADRLKSVIWYDEGLTYDEIYRLLFINKNTIKLVTKNNSTRVNIAGALAVSDTAKEFNGFLREHAFDSTVQKAYGSMLDFNNRTKEGIMKDLQLTYLTLPWQKDSLAIVKSLL